MSANNEQTRTCACTTQQYAPIIVDSVEYQNAANTIYQANYVKVAAAAAGTLSSPNGNPRFKSDYERMQYLLGSKNQVLGCGVARKIFTLGTN
jgi:hypothetical protein